MDTIGKRVEGVELDERGVGGNLSENGDGHGSEEVEGMRELQEELEVLKGEVTRLQRELDEEKEKKMTVEPGVVKQEQKQEEKTANDFMSKDMLSCNAALICTRDIHIDLTNHE